MAVFQVWIYAFSSMLTAKAVTGPDGSNASQSSGAYQTGRRPVSFRSYNLLTKSEHYIQY